MRLKKRSGGKAAFAPKRLEYAGEADVLRGGPRVAVSIRINRQLVAEFHAAGDNERACPSLDTASNAGKSEAPRGGTPKERARTDKHDSPARGVRL